MGRHMSDIHLPDLWDRVSAHFSTAAALSRVEVMAQMGTQAEGWWKAEMMFLLECLCRDNSIQHWCPEASSGIGGQKVDLIADAVVIELKTALCTRQKGVIWRLQDHVDWIAGDVAKLSELKMRWHDKKQFFVVVMAYPSPPARDWEILLEKIATKSTDVVTLSRIDEIGNGLLSIGWLNVG